MMAQVHKDRRVKVLVALVFVVGVLILFGVSSARGQGNEPTTGADQGLVQTNEELTYLRSKGIPEDDPVIQTLLQSRAQLLAMSQLPPPPPPDPAVVDRLLNVQPSEPSWDRGEVPCEGTIIKEAEAALSVELGGSQIRCVVVPRADGTALSVHLTDKGWALVQRVHWAAVEGKAEYVQVSIPSIDDLALVQIELVDEDLHIIGPTGELVISTRAWFVVGD